MTVTEEVHRNRDSARSKHVVVSVFVACLLVPLVGFGTVWASHAKPWLMDDFRAGYEAGSQAFGVVEDPNKAGDRCDDLMGSAYGIDPQYRQYETPEPASAYWWGCTRALNGLSDDWWNAAGYLTA